MLDFLLLAVTALQLVDFATTAFALRTRRAAEANPLMARIMKRIGVIPALIITKGTVVALAIFLWSIDSLLWLVILAVAYAVVTFNNLRLIKR